MPGTFDLSPLRRLVTVPVSQTAALVLACSHAVLQPPPARRHTGGSALTPKPDRVVADSRGLSRLCPARAAAPSRTAPGSWAQQLCTSLCYDSRRHGAEPSEPRAVKWQRSLE